MASTSSARNAPLSMSSARPDASVTFRIGTLRTSMGCGMPPMIGSFVPGVDTWRVIGSPVNRRGLMPQRRESPAWASTAVRGVLGGSWWDAAVVSASDVAAYLTVATGGGTDLIALLGPSAVRLPFGIRVDGELPDAGSRVRVGHGTVDVDGRVWRPVRWWDPRPRVRAGDLLRH